MVVATVSRSLEARRLISAPACFIVSVIESASFLSTWLIADVQLMAVVPRVGRGQAAVPRRARVEETMGVNYGCQPDLAHSW